MFALLGAESKSPREALAQAFFFKWEELFKREKPQAKFCLFNQNDND